MTQSEMAAMLGRPLTLSEVTNFTTYLEIARQLLEDVICFDTCSESEVRSFKARDGYSTLFTGAFSYASEVLVNGTVVTDYAPQLWDKLNSKWYNSLVFSRKLKRGDVVAVTAQWGFSKLPADLKQLMSKYFSLASSGVKNEQNIQSKKVEDFSITYANVDQTKAEQIADANSSTISKYSICSVGNLRNGATCPYHSIGATCGRCI